MSIQKAKFDLFNRLAALGFTYEESNQLRRIQLTLHRWAEHECNGNVQRTEARKLALHQLEAGDAVRVVALNWKGEPGYTVKELPDHIRDTNDAQAIAILERLQLRENEHDGKPRWHYGDSDNSYPIADREGGALKRLARIVSARNARAYVGSNCVNPVRAYHQGDPRGCALYLVAMNHYRADEIAAWKAANSGANDAAFPFPSLDSLYNRGVAVCA